MKFFDVGEQMTTIYGLFDEAGVCLYVGQSLNLWERGRAHKRVKPQHEARILLRCRLKNAAKIELQLIRKFKRLGQCKLNIADHELSAIPASNKGCKFYLPKYDLAFNSIAQIARFLGVSVCTVKNHIRDGHLIAQKLAP